MTNIEGRMDKLEQVAKNKIKDQVSNMKDDIITSLKSDINTIVDARNRELENRKRHELNLTVFNLPEHNHLTGLDNKRADESDIINISNSLGMEGLNKYVLLLRCKRNSKARMLKIILDAKSQRKYLLENARYVRLGWRTNIKTL